jgi:2-methylisocitrate lyase-like PEP mutase family enzyme
VTDTGPVARFRSLHVPGRPLVLPNVWDAASARAVESAGAAAIATSSAALANAAGHPDGEALPRADLVQIVRRIAALVAVPLTVDVEEGYGATPAEAAETVALVAGAGAAGVNVEDGAGPSSRLADKIRAIRGRLGQAVFINARTDVYLKALVPAADALAETLARIRLYREAGADGAFVPALADLDAMGTIAGRSGLPLNVMVVPGFPAVPALAAAGVARVSVGGSLFHATLSLAQRATEELLGPGTYGSLYDGSRISYRDANGLVARR